MPETVLPLPFEPKRESRFSITLPPEFELPTFVTFYCDRPSLRLNEDGTHDWLPITFKFYDPIGPSTTQRLWDLVIGLSDFNITEVYKVPHGGRYSDLKDKFAKFKDGFDFQLELLDPVGDIVESWDILGCKIKYFDFGKLDVRSESVVTPSISVTPKRVRLNY